MSVSMRAAVPGVARYSPTEILSRRCRDKVCKFGVEFRGPIRVPRCARLCISMRLNGSNMETPGFEANTAVRYAEDTAGQPVDEQPVKSWSYAETAEGKLGMDVHVHEGVPIPKKRAAKIHDFCFGIPFGGFTFAGGLVVFLFSRNPATLRTGLLFGGALLVLSSVSLKVWRQGKSSLPFIMGQAAIAAALLGKHFRMYSLTKNLFPTGIYALLCAAMLCFYSYVMISGGNPPPKKLQQMENPAS